MAVEITRKDMPAVEIRDVATRTKDAKADARRGRRPRRASAPRRHVGHECPSRRNLEDRHLRCSRRAGDGRRWLAMEHRDEYQSEAAALTAIAGKLGCSPDSLRVWVRQAQRDGGERSGQTTAEKARIKALEREVCELRQGEEGQKTVRGTVFPTNGILKKVSAYLAQAELDRPFRK